MEEEVLLKQTKYVANSFYPYYNFLSGHNASMSWSQPYDDKFKLGRVITVSYPAYINQNGQQKIVGVAGIDIRIDYILSKFSSQIKDQNSLILNTNGQLNCFVSTGEIKNNITTVVSSSVQIYSDLPESNVGYCCISEKNIGAIIGGVVGRVTGLIIIVLVIYLVYSKVLNNSANQAPKTTVRADGPNLPVSGNNLNNAAHQGQLLNDQQRADYIRKHFHN